VFTSRDAWEGEPTRPASLHKYAYTENDPVNWVDPTGWAKIRIWTAAFISPAAIVFPHPKRLDPFAIWHGDGRQFANTVDEPGNPLPSSRVWHRISVDTDPGGGVSYDEGTGPTVVDWKIQTYNPPRVTIASGTDIGKAPEPDAPIITRDGCSIWVFIKLSGEPGKNPLGPSGTSGIEYWYNIFIDLFTGFVTVNGLHSEYPWHEVVIEGIQDHPVAFEHYDPGNKTPANLFSGAIIGVIQTEPITSISSEERLCLCGGM
jgi:hypothetical protein